MTDRLSPPSTAVTAGSEPVLDRYPTRTAARPELLVRTDPAVWGGLSAPGPFSADELADYDRTGFSAVPALLGPQEVADLAAELVRFAADPAVREDRRTVIEKSSQEVRSVFEVHRTSQAVAALVADERVIGRARQVLGSDVYVHQSRINYKPGFGGGGFYWHSDFETWHAEDGMPAPRAASISIALTENFPHNGCLMIIPGSHRTFVPCVGETPEEHFTTSLREQGRQVGTPDDASLATLTAAGGISLLTGAAGSATMFDSNCMHGSANNITPYPRSNLFVVFNSVQNRLVEPFAAPAPRPEHIAARG
ncbi:ectoine hydroxylase [Rhodococcus sp. X156]|uniref:ectoine hydroxylase n=1 Tax=Rhodococcus sp. X156 TaxID=2499145 RepID=UPI001F4974D2|nr:ectoine hydroxylase [Rhodococcus sp. X156]